MRERTRDRRLAGWRRGSSARTLSATSLLRAFQGRWTKTAFRLRSASGHSMPASATWWTTSSMAPMKPSQTKDVILLPSADRALSPNSVSPPTAKPRE